MFKKWATKYWRFRVSAFAKESMSTSLPCFAPSRLSGRLKLTSIVLRLIWGNETTPHSFVWNDDIDFQAAFRKVNQNNRFFHQAWLFWPYSSPPLLGKNLEDFEWLWFNYWQNRKTMSWVIRGVRSEICAFGGTCFCFGGEKSKASLFSISIYVLEFTIGWYWTQNDCWEIL